SGPETAAALAHPLTIACAHQRLPVRADAGQSSAVPLVHIGPDGQAPVVTVSQRLVGPSLVRTLAQWPARGGIAKDKVAFADGQRLAIGRERQRRDGVRQLWHRGDLAPGPDLPEVGLGRAVVLADILSTAGGQVLAIG